MRPRSQGGKAGERPPEEQGGFLSPYLPQPTASWWFLLSEQREIRPFLQEGTGLCGCRLQAVQADFQSSHCTSRWWSDLQLRFQRRQLRGPKRSMYDVCHSARSELMRDPVSPPRSPPDPNQKERQHAATHLKADETFELRFLRPASPNLQIRTSGYARCRRWYNHARKRSLEVTARFLKQATTWGVGGVIHRRGDSFLTASTMAQPKLPTAAATATATSTSTSTSTQSSKNSSGVHLNFTATAFFASPFLPPADSDLGL